MPKIFRISEGRQRGCDIYFTSIPLSRPHASRLLKAFLSVLSNSIGFWCVNQKGLDILERSLVRT